MFGLEGGIKLVRKFNYVSAVVPEGHRWKLRRAELEVTAFKDEGVPLFYTVGVPWREQASRGHHDRHLRVG